MTPAMTAAVLISQNQAACPPSESDVVVAVGILFVSAAVVVGALAGIGIALFRFVRQRAARSANFVTPS